MVDLTAFKTCFIIAVIFAGHLAAAGTIGKWEAKTVKITDKPPIPVDLFCDAAQTTVIVKCNAVNCPVNADQILCHAYRMIPEPFAVQQMTICVKAIFMGGVAAGCNALENLSAMGVSHNDIVGWAGTIKTAVQCASGCQFLADCAGDAGCLQFGFVAQYGGGKILQTGTFSLEPLALELVFRGIESRRFCHHEILHNVLCAYSYTIMIPHNCK